MVRNPVALSRKVERIFWKQSRYHTERSPDLWPEEQADNIHKLGDERHRLEAAF